MLANILEIMQDDITSQRTSWKLAFPASLAVFQRYFLVTRRHPYFLPYAVMIVIIGCVVTTAYWKEDGKFLGLILR